MKREESAVFDAADVGWAVIGEMRIRVEEKLDV
jgi:hypothetical protein